MEEDQNEKDRDGQAGGADDGICLGTDQHKIKLILGGIGMSRYEGDVGNPYLNEHGKYVVLFAKNHGITTEEAHKHPTVKAHKEVIDHLAECLKFANGMEPN